MHLLSPSVPHFSIRSIDTDIQLTSALLQQLVILSLSIISWVEHEKASSIPLCVPFSLLMEIFFLCILSTHVLWQCDYVDSIFLLLIFQYLFSHLLPKWLSIKSSENLPISLWVRVNQFYYKFIKLSRSTEAVELVNSVTVSSTRVFAITAESMSPFCNISLITHSAIIVYSLITPPLRLFVKVQWTGAP